MNNDNEQLQVLFNELKLHSFMDTLKCNIDKKLNNVDLLVMMCEEEIKVKSDVSKRTMIKTAGFPSIKTIEDFDFSYQQSVNEDKIKLLSKLDFIENGDNIILTGSPGVGKTHLAIGIGIKSASKRISTYFIKAQKLINSLRLAYDENRLEARLKQYNRYKVLIIDEMGFIPMNELEAKLFFQLIELRYENRSTIITSNLTVDKWEYIFNDILIANAITDRLLHHCTLFNINGDSYRIKHLVDSESSLK